MLWNNIIFVIFGAKSRHSTTPRQLVPLHFHPQYQCLCSVVNLTSVSMRTPHTIVKRAQPKLNKTSPTKTTQQRRSSGCGQQWQPSNFSSGYKRAKWIIQNYKTNFPENKDERLVCQSASSQVMCGIRAVSVSLHSVRWSSCSVLLRSRW